VDSTVELTVTTSGPKPVKLLSSGKKKTVYVVTATAVVDDTKVTLKVEGPDKDGLEDVLGTTKLGDVVICDISPENPE